MSSLMFDLILTFMMIAAGIVTSGIIASLYALITDETPRFSMLQSEGSDLFISLLVLIFTGPVVLFRNSYYGRVLENRPLTYVFGGAALAASWGMILGNFVILIGLKIA